MSPIRINIRKCSRPRWAVLSLTAIFLLSLFLCSTSLAQSPGTLEEWLDKGWHYYNTHDYDEAFNVFLECVHLYPGSAEAHLALGELYLKRGVIDRGREQLLFSLELDDSTSHAARTHYSYASSIREENPTNALLHLYRAIELGGSTQLQLDIAQQIRFCTLLISMNSVSESGMVKIHFAPYLMAQTEADALAEKIESDLFLAERFTDYRVVETMHIFLYASERALRAELRDGDEELDASHREFHVVYDPNFDYLTIPCHQIHYDLQESLNRHAGLDWPINALPQAVLGRVKWYGSSRPGPDLPDTISVDDAVRAMDQEGILVRLEYLLNPEVSDITNPIVSNTELGSFLMWVKNNYGTAILQDVITQPNIEVILAMRIDDIERKWLASVDESASMISDLSSALEWARAIPVSPVAGNPDLPVQILKDGLRMYLNGQVGSGLREIHRALEIDPGLGLAYYTLGWIAAQDENWDEAEDYLSQACIFIEDPAELAWCHAYLSPIYLNRREWDKAHASLVIVMGGIDSPELQGWALEQLAFVEHVKALTPNPPLGRDSMEGNVMTTFMFQWNSLANSNDNVGSLVSSLMDDTRSYELINFYDSIRSKYPQVIFNHSVQQVGASGSAILVEVNLQARTAGNSRRNPPAIEPIFSDGLKIYFQVLPTEDGWKVMDWEIGFVPITIPQYAPSVQNYAG